MYVSTPQPAFLLEFSDHPYYLSFMPPYTTCLDYETHSLVFGDLSTTFLHLLLYFFASALLRLFFHLSLPANSHYVFDLPSLSGLFWLDLMFFLFKPADAVLQKLNLQFSFPFFSKRLQHDETFVNHGGEWTLRLSWFVWIGIEGRVRTSREVLLLAFDLLQIFEA